MCSDDNFFTIFTGINGFEEDKGFLLRKEKKNLTLTISNSSASYEILNKRV